jgi:hypothetical protein
MARLAKSPLNHTITRFDRTVQKHRLILRIRTEPGLDPNFQSRLGRQDSTMKWSI